MLGEHASARFIRLGRKFGNFPKSGCSINKRLQQSGEGTASFATFMCQTHVIMITDFQNLKWEIVREGGVKRWMGDVRG